MTQIADRIINLTPSPTVSLNAKVTQMKESGIDILNLTAGQPDMPTPKHICDKAIEAIRSGKHGYTPPNGILELRKTISKKYLKEYNLEFNPETEIIVGVGAKELVYHSLLATINEGDEVIIPTPCWTTYIEQVKLAGGKPVLIELENFDKLEIAKIIAKITNKTKAIILNYPCNPTGAVFDKNNLEELAKIVIQKNLIVISDEMYEKILFEETKFNPFVSLFDELKNRVITINGVSKAYAMTGWRLGFACGNEKFIKAMTSLEGQTTSNTSVISQWASVEAIENGEGEVQEMVKIFAKRREFLIRKLDKIEGLEFSIPKGAFYLFLDLRKILQESETCSTWCEKLLEEKKVALVPGVAFAAPGFARLSFAASDDILIEAALRIKEFVENI